MEWSEYIKHVFLKLQTHMPDNVSNITLHNGLDLTEQLSLLDNWKAQLVSFILKIKHNDVMYLVVKASKKIIFMTYYIEGVKVKFGTLQSWISVTPDKFHWHKNGSDNIVVRQN